ncbi:MAG: signal peptidase I [Pseudomonadota bacterium]
MNGTTSPTLPAARAHRLWRRVRHSATFQFAFFLLLILASRSALADWNYVPSGSMKPTILEGDLIFVDRLAYDLKVPFTRVRLAEWGNPERGDVVVALSPEGGERIVKRVVGLPGDKIVLSGQTLTVNGERPTLAPLDGPAIAGLDARDLETHGLATETVLGHTRRLMVGHAPPSLPTSGTFTVPPGHYFLVGDHRNNSRDSRIYGAVPRADILGRATRVIGSMDITGDYSIRWGRFFEPM